MLHRTLHNRQQPPSPPSFFVSCLPSSHVNSMSQPCETNTCGLGLCFCLLCSDKTPHLFPPLSFETLALCGYLMISSVMKLFCLSSRLLSLLCDAEAGPPQTTFLLVPTASGKAVPASGARESWKMCCSCGHHLSNAAASQQGTSFSEQLWNIHLLFPQHEQNWPHPACQTPELAGQWPLLRGLGSVPTGVPSLSSGGNSTILAAPPSQTSEFQLCREYFLRS